jgi:lipopolysaccharide export system protein LptC
MTSAAARTPRHRHFVIRTRLARWAMFALPALAVILGIAIFRQAQIEHPKTRVPIGDAEVMPEAIDSISMENARFTGRDDRNRSFTVTAEIARQKSSDSDVVLLQHPKADLALASGREVAIDAESGVFVRTGRQLQLSGEIHLSDNRGFEFHTTSAHVDLGQNTASGDAPVEGHGPEGKIVAEGFRVLEDGDRVVFTGKTRLTVTPAEDTAPANGGAPSP